MDAIGPVAKQRPFLNTTVTPLLGCRLSGGNDPKSEQRTTDRVEPRGEQKVTVKLMGFSTLRFPIHTWAEEAAFRQRASHTAERCRRHVRQPLPYAYSVSCSHSSRVQPCRHWENRMEVTVILLFGKERQSTLTMDTLCARL